MVRRLMTAVVAPVLALALLAPGAQAGPSPLDAERVVEKRYGCELRGTPPAAYVRCRNGFSLKTYARDSAVSVELAEDTGRPAPGWVGQDLDGDGTLDWKREFCETTEGFLPITGRVRLQVQVVIAIGVVDLECGGVGVAAGVAGSMKATFR